MLKEPILKILSKIYQPDTMIQMKFKRYDLAFKTDPMGRAILLFIGEKDVNGRIKGERYARRLLENTEGIVLKDHWDHKGLSLFFQPKAEPFISHQGHFLFP